MTGPLRQTLRAATSPPAVRSNDCAPRCPCTARRVRAERTAVLAVGACSRAVLAIRLKGKYNAGRGCSLSPVSRVAAHGGRQSSGGCGAAVRDELTTTPRSLYAFRTQQSNHVAGPAIMTAAGCQSAASLQRSSPSPSTRPAHLVALSLQRLANLPRPVPPHRLAHVAVCLVMREAIVGGNLPPAIHTAALRRVLTDTHSSPLTRPPILRRSRSVQLQHCRAPGSPVAKSRSHRMHRAVYGGWSAVFGAQPRAQ